MWTYEISVEERRVYALWNGRKVNTGHWMPFCNLVESDPDYYFVDDEGRREAYSIARDELIDRELITIEG